MMDCFCAAVKREISDRKVFSEKEEAFDYYDERFGKDILNDRKEQEKKLLDSVERCNKQLIKPGIDRERVMDLKDRREKEIKELHKAMNRRCCYYVWRFDEFRKNLIEVPVIDLLRTCGVYRAVDGKYEVLEELYVCVSEAVKNISDVNEVLKNLPERINDIREDAIMISAAPGKARLIDMISKTRIRILNEHKKNNRRISKAA